MCLIIANKEMIVADRDITCYKLFRKKDDGELTTPFQNFKVHYGERINDETEIQFKEICDELRVYGGVFHSFKYFVEAQEEMDRLNNAFKYINVVIIKCTIPKGTQLFIGDYNGNYSFGSETIIIGEKEIDTFDEIIRELKRRSRYSKVLQDYSFSKEDANWVMNIKYRYCFSLDEAIKTALRYIEADKKFKK